MARPIKPPPPLPYDYGKSKEISIYPTRIDEFSILQSLLSVSKRVNVVGIIGESCESTTRFANRLIQRRAFSSKRRQRDVESGNIWIRLYYDDENSIVYLLGTSENLYTNFPSDNNSYTQIHEWIENCHLDEAKMLLFLFSCSHLMFLVHNNHRVSSSICRLYRTLHNAKLQLGNIMSEVLQEKAHVSPFTPLRHVPLVSFVFPLPKQIENKTSRDNVKSYRTSMESKITKILKPLRGSVVGKYVSSSRSEKDGNENRGLSSREKKLFNIDPLHGIIALSRNACTSRGEISNLIANLFDNIDNDYLDVKSRSVEGEEMGMKYAIQLIRKYSEKSLERSEVKNNSKYLPLTLSLWLKFTLTIESTLLDMSKCPTSSSDWISTVIYQIEKPSENIFSLLKSQLDPVRHYTDSKIAQELPRALHHYEMNVPSSYTSKTHYLELDRIVKEFRTNVGSIGPGCEECIEKLHQNCEEVWNNGRRLCDSMSVMGKPCIHPYHLNSEKTDFSSNDTSVAIENHSTGLFRLGSCNCGQTMSYIPEPFTLKEANCTSFKSACCNELVSLCDMSSYKMLYLSWSLLIVGEYNLYTHDQGFQGHGFIESMNFLSIIRSKYTKTRDKDNSGDKPMKEVYCGVEYECSNGHRFFRSQESKRSRHSRNSYKRSYEHQSDRKLSWTDTDIAIFINCPNCIPIKDYHDKTPESDSGKLAQLMRVHIAIPESVQDIQLHGIVKMNKNDNDGVNRVIFDTGSPVSLPQNSYVCFRLPYIYSFQDQVLLPKYSQLLQTVVLRRGFISS